MASNYPASTRGGSTRGGTSNVGGSSVRGEEFFDYNLSRLLAQLAHLQLVCAVPLQEAEEAAQKRHSEAACAAAQPTSPGFDFVGEGFCNDADDKGAPPHWPYYQNIAKDFKPDCAVGAVDCLR